MRERVIIIGAGPSGLVALKEMRAAGVEATVFEKSSSIGGVFRRDGEATYDELFLTTSNYFMAFSDFPPLERELKYSTKQEYTDYLHAYVEANELGPHIELEHEVVTARLDGATWHVEVRNLLTDEIEERTADRLVVATGSHHHPALPELDGWDGELVHSSNYRSPEHYADKRVLIVGAGESASDIAAEVAGVATKTVVWSRRPFLIAPRFPLAALEPGYDEHTVIADRPGDLPHVNDFLEFFTISRMANALSTVGYTLIRLVVFSVFRWAPFASPTVKHIESWTSMATEPTFWMQDQAMVVSKNARLATLAAQGGIDVVIAADIRTSGTTVSFEGRRDDYLSAPDDADGAYDVIIACTGYRTRLDWLEPTPDQSPRSWFRHCLPPGYGGRLMMLGWARPQQGGIPPCAELLARWCAQLASGGTEPPADLEQRIAAEADAARSFYRGTPHVESLVDYPAFMDSVADLVGCRPIAPNPLRSPKRFAQFHIYPNWSCWYRQRGPGSDPEVIDRFLEPQRFSLVGAFPLLVVHGVLLALSLPIHLADRLIGRFRRDDGGLVPGWMVRRRKGDLLHGVRAERRRRSRLGAARAEGQSG